MIVDIRCFNTIKETVDLWKEFQPGQFTSVNLAKGADSDVAGLCLAMLYATGQSKLLFTNEGSIGSHNKVLYCSTGGNADDVRRITGTALLGMESSIREAAVSNLQLGLIRPRFYRLDNQVGPDELFDLVSADVDPADKPDLIILDAVAFINKTTGLGGSLTCLASTCKKLTAKYGSAVILLHDDSVTASFIGISYGGTILSAMPCPGSTYQVSLLTGTRELTFTLGPTPDMTFSELSAPEGTSVDETELTSDNTKGHVVVLSVTPMDSDHNDKCSRLTHIINKMPVGEEIPLGTVSGGLAQLDSVQNTLDQQFPWLSSLTAWALRNLRGRLFAAESSTTLQVKLPPLLLVGPPGIGKTEWAYTLAQSLSVPFAVFSICGSNGNENLSSLGRVWKNAQPSRILKLMADSRVANPIVLLDELDKESRGHGYTTTQQALLPFLDRNATSIYDEFLEGYIDMSCVSFLATANTLYQIDSALVSRFEVIEPDRPEPDHAGIILSNMVNTFAAEIGISGTKLLDFSENIQGRLLEDTKKSLAGNVDLRTISHTVRGAMLANLTGDSRRFGANKFNKFGFSRET